MIKAQVYATRSRTRQVFRARTHNWCLILLLLDEAKKELSLAIKKHIIIIIIIIIQTSRLKLFGNTMIKYGNYDRN